MKLFELYWHWYEDYRPYLFIHEEKTHKEFQEDCKTMFVKYGDEYLKQETSWAGANNWIRFVANKLPELGYKRVEPESWGFFGSYIIDYEKLPREEDIKLIDIIGEDLYNKAASHNRKLNDEMMKRIEEDS